MMKNDFEKIKQHHIFFILQKYIIFKFYTWFGIGWDAR